MLNVDILCTLLEQSGHFEFNSKIWNLILQVLSTPNHVIQHHKSLNIPEHPVYVFLRLKC